MENRPSPIPPRLRALSLPGREKETGVWSEETEFTEVTGPGGIYGNSKETDPIWAMGWDARSVILMLFDEGKWHSYRLPKGSHSYDGAHGWNTEWPRIRDRTGQPTRHHARNFSAFSEKFLKKKFFGDCSPLELPSGHRGFRPVERTDRVRLRRLRPKRISQPPALQVGQGRSSPVKLNLWFVDSGQLDKLGPSIGRGSVWLRDDLGQGQVSEPYLFSGYDHRMMVIHREWEACRFHP